MKVTFRQILSVYLVVLMLRPVSMPAANSAAVLGSISSYGSVKVGEQVSPSQNTLFAGDVVKTQSGSAVIQYSQGARVALDKESSARFEASNIQLERGIMSFRAASTDGPVFNASTLRLQPAQSGSSANVSVQPGKATVTVTKGSVRAVDPTGVTLSVINAGETKLFAMASPAPAAPAAASAAAPPIPAIATLWLLVIGGVTAAVTTAVAVTSNNNSSDNAQALSPSAK
jgi:FecR-like protein